jgi:hypothetical protein
MRFKNRKEGAGPVNWKVLAEDLRLTVDQLKTLCKVRLPAESNWIPLSELSSQQEH